MNVPICTGGAVEWVTVSRKCDRCWHWATQYGRRQAWYDTDWTCGRCGMLNWRPGSPRRDRERALRVAAEFVAWLKTGSPKIDYAAECGS